MYYRDIWLNVPLYKSSPKDRQHLPYLAATPSPAAKCTCTRLAHSRKRPSPQVGLFAFYTNCTVGGKKDSKQTGYSPALQLLSAAAHMAKSRQCYSFGEHLIEGMGMAHVLLWEGAISVPGAHIMVCRRTRNFSCLPRMVNPILRQQKLQQPWVEWTEQLRITLLSYLVFSKWPSLSTHPGKAKRKWYMCSKMETSDMFH